MTVELKNITCKDYCTSCTMPYKVIENDKPQTVYSIEYYGDLKNRCNKDYNFPEKYIAELTNVNIIGSTSIIFDDNNNCIWDLPLNSEAYRYDLRNSFIYYCDKNNTEINYVNSKEVIEQGILLTSDASFNYYHFNLCSISKLCMINTIKEYDNIPLIVDDVVLQIPQFYEELVLVTERKRQIIFVKRGYSYKVNRLIYMSDLVIMPLNIKKEYKIKDIDVFISNIATNLIHDKLAINNIGSERIFISRKNISAKRLTNTEQVEKMFKLFGYKIVYPELMSFNEQRKLFSTAEFVAGVSGSGLTNMLFCNKKATMICISSKEIGSTCYSNIAGTLGQKYIFIDSKLNNDSSIYYLSSFTLDETYLQTCLSNVHKSS